MSRERALRRQTGVSKYYVFDELPSTNDWLLHQSERFLLEHGIVVCQADNQTAGKGQRGRVWQSQAGRSCLLSIAAWLPAAQLQKVPLSLYAGVMVAEAIEQVAGLSPGMLGLKWPNDIVMMTRDKPTKLGGLLVETKCESKHQTSLDSKKLVWCVLGIGLNVHHMQSMSFAADRYAIAAIEDLGGVATVDQVAAALAIAINDVLSNLKNDAAFAWPLESWAERDWLLGRTVVLDSDANDERMYQAKGTDARGRLRLQHEGGIDYLSGGSVSVRLR